MVREMRIRLGKALIAAAVCVILSGLCGCAKKEQISVSILDEYVRTQLLTASGQTVADILQEAEIDLNDRDEISPSADTEIVEDDSEILIRRCATVTVEDEGKKEEFTMTGAKVSDALGEAGITLGKNDIMNCDPEEYLEDHMDIRVIRRVAVTLKADGKKRRLLTEAKTVGELLEEQGIRVGKDDRISMKKKSRLKDGSKVVVERVAFKEVQQEETIAYSTEKKYSDSMSAGSSKVTRAGKDGKKTVVYKVTYVDGKEESREKVKETVTKQPVSKIVTYGTKKKSAGGGGNGGKKIVSKKKVADCDGSGHGYYVIKYSDGSVKYEDY